MNSDTVQSTSLAILTSIAAIAVLFILKPILIPFLIAVMISYIISPLVEKMFSYKIPRIITLLVIILLLMGLLANITQVLVSNGIEFAKDYPSYQEQFSTLLERVSTRRPWLDQVVNQFSSWIFALPVGSYVNTLLNSSVNLLSNTFLILLFVTYLCLSGNQMQEKVLKAFPGPQGKKIEIILSHINSDIRKYISLHTLMSIATGVSVTLVCFYFKVPFAPIWGFLAFTLNYIPTIGSIISSIPPVITAAVTVGVQPAVWVALLVLGIQSFWGNVIEPKLAGSSLGISPLVILLSLVFWSWLWGVVGAILAVPIAVILKVSCINIEPLRPIGILMGDE
jgi:AI-2 transport protein TqsA